MSKFDLTSESDIKADITKFYESMGCKVARQNAGRGRSHQRLCPKGWPDLLIVPTNGRRSFYVETKRPGEKPGEDQEEMHEILRKAGNEVFVMFSLDDAAKQWSQT